jgi:hydrogenase expression/formation protein HypC
VSRHTDADRIETAAIGDYVLIHAGYAIEKLDTEEALETLELLRQVYRAGRGEDVS